MPRPGRQSPQHQDWRPVTGQARKLALHRYHRVEVLGALASVLSTWLVTGILVVEAVNRILNPVEVNGKGGAWWGPLGAASCAPAQQQQAAP